MTRINLIGILLSALLGAAMAAGVLLTAPQAKADQQQDYEYFTILEQQGLVVTNHYRAKYAAQAICSELDSGTPWRSILKTIMETADWNLDSAASLFAVAVTVYCPSLSPAELDTGNVT